MFGQQWDERWAWVPNYDLFFFEVETRPLAGLRTGPSTLLRTGPSTLLRTGSEVKMLHEMQALRGGAWRDGQHDRLDAHTAALFLIQKPGSGNRRHDSRL